MGVTHETDTNDSNPDHAVPLLYVRSLTKLSF
jgi:hypothetical protein